MGGTTRDARRWLPRALLALVTIGIGVLLLPDATLDRVLHRDLEVVDVGARARAIAARTPNADSLTDWYYRGARASAHLHVIGPGQTVKLHLHELATEVSIPVVGAADVTQRAGSGVIASRREPGDVVISPRGCAHEWANASTSSQSNLVLSLGEPFAGNVFVAPDDPRVARAEAPPALGSDRAAEIVRLVDSSATSTVDVSGPTLVYVRRGQGAVVVRGEARPVATSTLVVWRGGKATMTFRGAPGLDLVVVTPP